MVFQWFFLPGPSPLNVFLEMDHWYQWFSNGFLEFWCNGQRWFWPRKNLKLRENCDISYFATTVRIILELENIKCFISQFLTMYPCQFQSYRVLFFRFKVVCFVFLVLWAHSFATIAELQWFSKVPSPLNGMVGGNHPVRWFSDGFWVPQTSCPDGFRWLSTISQTMRWGRPSLQSNPQQKMLPRRFKVCVCSPVSHDVWYLRQSRVDHCLPCFLYELSSHIWNVLRIALLKYF